NSSLERVDAAGSALSWGFGIDDGQRFPGASGAIVADTAMSGRRSFAVLVPAVRLPGTRAYWDNSFSISPSKQYVLSGYIKTEQVVSDPGFGAAIIAPV